MHSNIHLRGVNSALMNRIKKQALERKMSINSYILQILNESQGLATSRRVNVYHDLDKLAGTWTKNEAKTFAKNTEHFEKVDKDLWK